MLKVKDESESDIDQQHAVQLIQRHN